MNAEPVDRYLEQQDRNFAAAKVEPPAPLTLDDLARQVAELRRYQDELTANLKARQQELELSSEWLSLRNARFWLAKATERLQEAEFAQRRELESD